LIKSTNNHESKEIRYARSVQKENPNQLAHFDKFSDNILEVKNNNSRYSKSSRRKKGGKIKKKHLNFGRRTTSKEGLYPNNSSVGGDTIHEKSVEEDRDESSSYSQVIKERNEESKSEIESSEVEEGEESSSELESKVESDNLHSLEASSIIEGPRGLMEQQRSATALDNPPHKDKMTLDIEELEDF